MGLLLWLDKANSLLTHAEDPAGLAAFGLYLHGPVVFRVCGGHNSQHLSCFQRAHRNTWPWLDTALPCGVSLTRPEPSTTLHDDRAPMGLGEVVADEGDRAYR